MVFELNKKRFIEINRNGRNRIGAIFRNYVRYFVDEFSSNPKYNVVFISYNKVTREGII